MQPHRSRYWLTAAPEDPVAFHAQVSAVCTAYQEAAHHLDQGAHTVSCDEMTGVQALERAAPTLPMRPGLVERREFDYLRHGTCCLIANLEVATGQVICPTLGPTRTEEDFAAHIARTIATDAAAGWVFITDHLNTHMSASLVHMVAAHEGWTEALGRKGRSGVLASMVTREAYLTDATHRIRFLYIPKHTSWLNQIELWFSILVRRLLRRGSFASVEELGERILAFIDFFNRTAKPFHWTYTGSKRAA